jgi:hypothetical protein
MSTALPAMELSMLVQAGRVRRRRRRMGRMGGVGVKVHS